MNNLERFKRAINWEPTDRIMTYDLLDNQHILIEHGGYDPTRSYSFEELLEVNAKAWKSSGLDATRTVYDPVNHWMGGKIANWIRFFGVNPDNWVVRQAGETAWIAQRPFHTLQELEKHMPQLPRYEEVRDWYQPVIRQIQEVLREYDIVYIGAVEGPITDGYTYVDMELFATAIYEAPELVAHIMDCTGMFSAHIAAGLRRGDRGAAPLHGRRHRRQPGADLQPGLRAQGGAAALEMDHGADQGAGDEISLSHGRPLWPVPAAALRRAGGRRAEPHRAQQLQ